MSMNPLRWTRRSQAIIASTVVGAGLLIAGTALNANADSEKLSALEVACKVMADGDTPDQAYELIVDQLGDASYTVSNPELTARTAVDRALNGECD
jgi:hypothetical protein